MRNAIVVALFGLMALAPSARAAEVGECVPQKPGAFSDKACRAGSGAGNHEWRELTGAGASYTDGHPEVLYDEKQVWTGEGVTLECKGQVVVGQSTGFTMGTQLAQDNKCELLAPFRAQCGNTSANGIENNIYTTESGVFVDGPEGTVRDRLTIMSASFMCGGLEASLSGEYEGQVGYRFAEPTRSVLDKQIHKYDLLVAPGFGEQAITLTVGLRSWPVSLTGEQEDKYGTAYLVVQTPR
jgi:hypothetical protein